VKTYLIVVSALTQSEYAAKYGRDPGYKGCSRQADHSTTTCNWPLVIYFAGQRLHQELDDLRSQVGSRVAGATILSNEKTCQYSSSRTNIVPARSSEHACFKVLFTSSRPRGSPTLHSNAACIGQWKLLSTIAPVLNTSVETDGRITTATDTNFGFMPPATTDLSGRLMK
jgi:hypothetical protein